jgi:DNA repair photolyase
MKQAEMTDGGTGIAPDARRGRGVMSNAAGRYEAQAVTHFDDGWGTLDEQPPPLTTRVQVDASRTIIARNQSPDIAFDRSINPYRGCEHGCVYCFARPSHAWLGLSPGLDFESRLFAKPDAAKLLAVELRKPSYSPRPIAMGTNTDPYQPIEGRMAITRQVLGVLADFGHPVTIVTKSALVTRDIDILAPMAERGLAKVAVSVTTLDRRLARVMEPRAATPERRLTAIAALAKAGIPTGVMVAPIIPGLTCHELESILERAQQAGAVQAGYVMLRLPLEITTLFQEWLVDRMPDRAARVMKLVREMRGGRDYDAQWFARQRGQGPYAALIARRFRLTAKRLGFNNNLPSLRCDLFTHPPRMGDQLSLL